MAKRLCLLLLVLIATGWPALAQTIGPDPALSPEQVVSIQLDALKDNDKPSADAGIEQTFALAHPDNQRVTGPLERFSAMIRSPAYLPLIGHRSHRIETISADETIARFKVEIVAADGAVLTYLWEVRRLNADPNRGAWLTTAVSAPAQTGRAI